MVLPETRGFVKEFGGPTVLDDVGINVEEGEFTPFISPNGVGRSTLISMITGRLSPTEDQVSYTGIRLVGMKLFKTTQLGVSRPFQTALILPGLTVHKNVQVTSFAVEYGSFRVNFFHRRDSFDEVQSRTNDVLDTIGLNSKTRMEAGSLLYGDKRRLEAVIGLVTDPDLPFTDKPTAGMPSTETRMAVNLIRDLLAGWGITIFLVEHDMDIIFDVSDRTSTFHQGWFITQETPEEIRENPAVREAYLGDKE